MSVPGAMALSCAEFSADRKCVLVFFVGLSVRKQTRACCKKKIENLFLAFYIEMLKTPKLQVQLLKLRGVNTLIRRTENNPPRWEKKKKQKQEERQQKNKRQKKSKTSRKKKKQKKQANKPPLYLQLYLQAPFPFLKGPFKARSINFQKKERNQYFPNTDRKN